MTVFWITLASTFGLTKLSDYYAYRRNKTYKPNKFFYFTAVFILIMIAGLRRGIGDTSTYRDLFDSAIPDVSFYLKQFDTLSEYGFWVTLAFIKQFISTDSQVFIFLYATITISLICYTLYKNCDPAELGIFYFITMGGYLVVMNGMRQYLASAILFAAFPLIEKKKWYLYFPIVYLASTIHSSAIIMIPLYFLLDKKAWGTTTVLFLTVGVGLYVTYNITGPIIADLIKETSYGNYADALISNVGGANFIRAIVSFVPVFLSYKCRKTIVKNEKYGNIIINGMLLNFIFTLLANKYWIYARMNVYFSLYSIVALCYVIKYAFTYNSTKLVYYLSILLYFLYYYYSMVISMGINYTSNFF